MTVPNLPARGGDWKPWGDAMDVNLRAGWPVTVKRLTASRTLDATDAGVFISAEGTSAKDFTVPMNATWAAAIGTMVSIYNEGSGVTRLLATTTDQLLFAFHPLSKANVFTIPTDGMITITKIKTNAWYVVGDFT